MHLSVVIPVFNESGKIAMDIESALEFLDKNGMSGEIIVVDDGSTDRTADVVTLEIDRCNENIHLISYKPNRGKGFAVRKGILKARGEIIMFIDSGNCVPYDDIMPAIRLIEKDKTDIAHASRFLKESKIINPRCLHRRLLSWSFRKFIRLYADLPDHITDSQCGLSVYRGTVARKLYSECLSDGFLFDLEIIIRADNKGYRIIEFPVNWTPDRDSRLRPWTLIFKIGPELRKIKKQMTS